MEERPSFEKILEGFLGFCFLKYKAFFCGGLKSYIIWNIRSFFIFCIFWNIRNFFQGFRFLKLFNIRANKFHFLKYQEFFLGGFCSLKFFNIRARRFHFLKYKELLFGWIFFIFLSLDLKVRCSNMLWIRLRLIVKEIWAEKKSISKYAWKSIKNQSVTEWYRSGKCGAMGKNVECLCCHEVEVVEYFDLLGIIYGDMNVFTQGV